MTDTALSIDPATTALVLIDLQRGIVAADTFPIEAMEVVARAARLAAACRDAGVTVILVHVDPGPDGVLFPRLQADQPRPPMKPPADFAELMPELGRQPSDVVVTKHQPNAFYNTDLEVQLVRRRIRTIILGGISTNVGVEATARSAHERGLRADLRLRRHGLARRGHARPHGAARLADDGPRADAGRGAGRAERQW